MGYMYAENSKYNTYIKQLFKDLYVLKFDDIFFYDKYIIFWYDGVRLTWGLVARSLSKCGELNAHNPWVSLPPEDFVWFLCG